MVQSKASRSYNIGFGDCLMLVVHSLGVEAIRNELGSYFLGTGEVAVPDGNFRDGTDGAVRASEKARKRTGSEHDEIGRIFTSQIPSRERRCASSAPQGKPLSVNERAVVRRSCRQAKDTHP